MRFPLVLLFTMMLDGAEPPTSWVDPDTGHRVVRLTTEPGSASLYFNQNGYTADGKKMVYTTPGGISVLDLATQVHYLENNAVWAADVDTGAKHRLRSCRRAVPFQR